MRPTPIQALEQHAHDHPDRPAFLYQDKTWTFAAIAREADRLARGMAARGVRPGDRVALHMMNRPEYIAAYYACFRLGAIAAPLRTAFKFAELEPILRRLRPALYIGAAELYGNVAPIEALVLPPDRRVILGETACQEGQPWESLLDAAGNGNAFGAAAHDPAALITTSGTTGEPKFVVHTASTLAETVDLWVRNWGILAGDIVAVPLPLPHMSGLASLLCYMQLGARFVLLESFDADAVLDAIELHRCSFHIGFPAQYAAMLESQCLKPRNLQSLRYCLTGGDACPVDLQRQVSSAFGAPLHNVWAATEASGNLKFGLRPGPVMRTGNGAEIRLVDNNGKDAAVGEIGELLLRGENLFDGYWNDPEATAASLKDSWYRTGDLVRRGEGDELLFVARKKDIIIRGGTNISPAEVEQAIVASHPDVEEAAVIGIPDAVLGQRVLGFIKLANGANQALLPEILDNLVTRLAAYKVPERLIAIDALPRSTLSKVDRKALQGMATELGSLCKAPPGAARAPAGQEKRRSRGV